MGSDAGGLGGALSSLGQSTGLSNIAGGISDLFGGAQTPAEGTPGGPELVGPPSPYKAPSNFMQGFAQGFIGMNPGQGADTPMSPGTELASGIGQLMHAINQARSPQQMVNTGMQKLAGPSLQGPEMGPGYQQAQAPQSGLLHRIIQGLTYGIIDSPKMGSQV